MAGFQFDFSIDRGGTFCDVYAAWHDASMGVRGQRVLKLLSEDPGNYPDAPREGIRRILEEVTGTPHPRTEPVPTRQIRSIRMGTTVATNALLERKGARMALLVTAGFRDLLAIGNQARPLIFDLKIARPDNLYEQVLEVDERLVLVKEGEELPQHAPAAAGGGALPIVTGSTGERFLVERAPDLAALRPVLAGLLAGGITSLAVAFLHSFAYPEHERAVGELALALGFTQVSLSSGVMPMLKVVPRGYTAAADAYLSPHIHAYVAGFRAGFEGGLEGGGTQLLFMQSDGGLVPAGGFNGSRAVLSGPAGGVVGYSQTTFEQAGRRPIVAIDVGGTSSDVSRYAGGGYSHVYETTTAGVTIQAPQLDISTVAAGGGSRLFYRNGLFVVGPESAGAHPGPVCYRKGGHLAVTDANLALGRIVVEEFPHIFGPSEDQPLDEEGTLAAFAKLAEEVNAGCAASGEAPKSTDEIAFGFVRVANEAMCRPIRALTQMRGYDITTHVLSCFGGAGPQHACDIARSLGMRTIYISRYGGILSAYGISLADVVSEAQAPAATTLVPAPEGADAVTAAAADPVAAAAPSAVPAEASTDLASRLAPLLARVGQGLQAQGFPTCRIAYRCYLNLRYSGSDSAMMVPLGAGGEEAGAEGESGEGETGAELPYDSLFAPDGVLLPGAQERLRAAVAGAASRFVSSFRREFSFTLPGRSIVADDVRVRGVARGEPPHRLELPKAEGDPAPSRHRSVFFEGGRVSTPVYMLKELGWGHSIPGPALLLDATSTILVEPGFTAHMTQYGDVCIEMDEGGKAEAEGDKGAAAGGAAASAAVPAPAPSAIAAAGGAAAAPSADGAAAAAAGAPAAPALSDWRTNPLLCALEESYPDHPCDPIQLSIFAHRFMGIAEQMGRTLQRTSVSVNIRERLDFSCAVFDPSGGLVANAPFIPVHLGAMADAVRAQLAYWGSDLEEGDVLVSNHPQLAGGSHLPDITVITPVFHDGKIVFFVASRGHHADIGGIAPGSMPPLSRTLAEEGAAIVAFKLVRKGAFQEAGITELLMAPAKIPGCAGSRNLADCLSDLRAQVAGNHRGIGLVKELIAEHGLRRVHAYMRHIQAAAEAAVRDMLVAFSLSRGLPEVGTVRAREHMDDGTPICLAITIDRRTRSASFDFAGTGAQVLGNHNAPRAVTYSAVIYCLRCLVGADIPLNQGCLTPVSIAIPRGSILDPAPTAAVVGGNVLTSQRVVDVVLKAFGACAASQGCMNNLTFGATEEQGKPFGYYETICGGAGAGPTWVGRSGVHTHMTNTRLGDPEVVERRYPVIIRRFSLREGSGGAGAHRGGDGVVRELQFRRLLTVSILSERRSFRPYGMAGGRPGARGVNTLLRWEADPAAPGGGRYARVNLGGKATVDAKAGDVLRLDTPGGGGFGAPAAGAPGARFDDEAEEEAAPASADAAPAAGGAPSPLPAELSFRAGGSLKSMAETEADF